MIYSPVHWDLDNKTMIINYPLMKKGEHIIQVKAAVDGGTLYVPHFLPGALDVKQEPKLFGSVTAVGYI